MFAQEEVPGHSVGVGTIDNSTVNNSDLDCSGGGPANSDARAGARTRCRGGLHIGPCHPGKQSTNG